MKKYSLLFVLFVTFTPAFTQIVINEADMPKEGDTLRVSMTTNIPGDYNQTGLNITWDFSGLIKMSQQLNSFVDVLNTQGRIVMEKDLLASPDNTVSLNLSDLPTGLYMIRLIDQEVIYTGKILIIR